MRLHEDKNAFRLLLETIHEKTGYRTDVLEKDYYVLLILHELAGFQADGLPAFFKGGTALYKALKTTNRSEVIAVYTYDPVTAFDENDALQRFGKLKVEAYVRHSSVNHRAFEAAKHIYDLAVIADHPKIKKLFSDADKLKHLLEIRMEEEQGRLDGIPGVTPAEFTFFTQTGENDDVRKAYKTMQNQYVLREQDRIAFETAVKALIKIHERLLVNPAWVNYSNL